MGHVFGEIEYSPPLYSYELWLFVNFSATYLPLYCDRSSLICSFPHAVLQWLAAQSQRIQTVNVASTLQGIF